MIGAAKFLFIQPPLIVPGRQLYAWGDNGSGQLGDGTTNSKSSPIAIGSSANWTFLENSTSQRSSFLIKDGKLFDCGAGTNGMLAQGNTTSYSSPVQVGSDTDWAMIAAGANHAAGIKSGKLYTWGLNSSGQLGLGDTTDRSSPVQVGSATDWTFVACSISFTLAIRNGALYRMGNNDYNQGGTGASCSSPVQVGAATDWTYAAGTNLVGLGIRGGTLWASGYGFFKELGNGTNNWETDFVQVGSDTDWQSVVCGQQSVYALRGGRALEWGTNASASLSSNSPIQIGSDTDWTKLHARELSIGGLKSGKLYMWGNNNSGQLGIGSYDYDPHASPIQIGSATDWINIAAGYDFTLGVRGV